MPALCHFAIYHREQRGNERETASDWESEYQERRVYILGLMGCELLFMCRAKTADLKYLVGINLSLILQI